MEPTHDATPRQNWTVAQVLSAYPQAAPAFFQLKTDCVGCVLSRFCTLKDVARAYNLDLENMIAVIHQTINSSQPKE